MYYTLHFLFLLLSNKKNHFSIDISSENLPIKFDEELTYISSQSEIILLLKDVLELNQTIGNFPLLLI